jgi:hypothetical protein
MSLYRPCRRKVPKMTDKLTDDIDFEAADRDVHAIGITSTKCSNAVLGWNHLIIMVSRDHGSN